MKRLLLSFAGSLMMIGATAQTVTATWEMSDIDNLQQVNLTGNDQLTEFVTPSMEVSGKIAKIRSLESSNADSGYEAVTYVPAFAAFTPDTKASGKSTGHYVSFTMTPETGHKFKPTSLSFDACKVGTDKGGFDIYYKIGDGEQVSAGSVSPLRNKVAASNPNACSSHELTFSDLLTDGEPITFYLYLTDVNGADNSSPKELALRNVVIKGAVDEVIKSVSDYVTSLSCSGALKQGEITTIDLTALVAPLKFDETAAYKERLFGEPTDFEISLAEGFSSEFNYNESGHVMSVSILNAEEDEVMKFGVRFKVTNRQPKGEAQPLKRGLMAINLAASGGSGNLVSWRHFEKDGYGVKYKLYKGTTLEEQNLALNGGEYITSKTNFEDKGGSTMSIYRLETYDAAGNLLSSEGPAQTWENQSLKIPVETPEGRNSATYSPNDASYCDMDGDGEYEIILKWSPSNEKDAASSGSTAPIYVDCYKLDGTRLWRIDAGPNFFTSAHTMQFIAWDFDGDGYGEFMMKTAPGTIDGEGNYVLLGDDDPTENLLSGRGKQDHGSEYITVFDGLTGAELATIPYHTDYAAGLSVWGDSNQNRSERYLAAIAWLDGPDANPSPIFARGYYKGAFVGAYDWDGTTLKERWVSRNTKSGEGLWGEGAHWISVGDCDGDGRQEIVYGSAALDDDGSLLYRTGLGHGDALHLGDFLPERPGMEVFMVHEEKPYGYDLRDAATGEFILRKTESGDTGRGLAAHFDSSSKHSQFIYSASSGMFDCETGEEIAESWTIGSSGAAINCRVYWDGTLYDEFFDKSIIAHWNAINKSFDRYQVNGGNYLPGTLNNSTKKNPCVLGDLLGDWREEIVTWTEEEGQTYLLVNATNYPTSYRIPHLMDDLNYRAQVINQNVCYNQPPHLSFDPSVKYAGNPNKAQTEDITSAVETLETEESNVPDVIYTIQGIRVDRITTPGLYIVNGKKVMVK